MATLDRPLTFRTRHGRFTVRHASLMPAVLRYVRTLDAVIERRECGANAKGGGGFQAGNTCGKGEGGGGGSSGGSKKSGRVHDATGLPMNDDGTVTVYHHTSSANAEKIKETGKLKSAGEPHVYVTTQPDANTGYGDTVVPIKVDPDDLELDDEFPGGRKDFKISVDRPGGEVKVALDDGEGKDKGGASAGGGGVEPHAPVTKEHSQQARALSSGVKNSYARKLAEEAYAQHLANGGKAPEIVSHKFSGYKATAMYSQSNDKIYVNASVSAKSEEAFRRSVESGFLSQPNPILHELGHKVHADALGNSYDSAKNHVFSAAQKEKISKEVSKYAATNGLEFAAEVYAGVGAGKKYSDEVLRMFASVTQGKVLLRGPAK